MEIAFGQQTTKVKQLADTLSKSISMNEFQNGDPLPSINQLSNKYKVSRDTVFKAFLDLRERGLIDSTPGKGYYVISHVTNILLLLDQYSPFKDVLYNSFIKHLPTNYKVDILFHQYNEHLFNTIIRESIGKYNKYIVMNFDNEKLSKILYKIDKSKLLLLDFGKFNKDGYSYICQNFDENFYNSFLLLKNKLCKYRKLILLFPKELKHPQSSKLYFQKFCKEHGFLYDITENIDSVTIHKGEVYITIRQQDIVRIIKESRLHSFRCGKDFGLIAYNDIPSYEIIEEGITSLSINWETMGNEIADFVINNTPIYKFLPTEIIMRNSL